MNIKKTICALLLAMVAPARAATTTIWQGSQRFSNWSDALNIDGSKLSNAKTDDVLRLSINASSGAQLQLSWGSSWTCFEGLNALSISGNYEMLLSTADANRLHQGIHIKGVNYTLTAVTLVSNDGDYTTQSEELFAWSKMHASGATKGKACTVGIKAYGGVGWYWPEPIDLSGYGSIVVTLLQPAAETLIAQLLFDERGVKSQTLEKGVTQWKMSFSNAHRKAYSMNLISQKPQIVALGSVNLTDKEGNIVSSAIEYIHTDSRVLSVEYYNTAGVRLTHAQRGINIVRTKTAEGRIIVRKEQR